MCRTTILKNAILILCFLTPLNGLGSQDNCELPFTVEKGVIHCPEGIPRAPRWFTDDRLAFSMDETGFPEIAYYVEGGGTIFLQHLWDGFRYYLVRDELNYRPVYRNNRIRPFGIESEWEMDGLTFRHKVLAIDERMILEIRTPEDLEEGYRFRFDFNTAYGLTYSDKRDFRYPTAPGREWKDWRFDKDENVFSGGYINQKDGTEIACVIGADFPMDYGAGVKEMMPNLTSPFLEAGKTYRFIVNFADSEKAALEKNSRFIETAEEKLKAQFGRYEAVGNNIPVLTSPYKELDRYFGILPMYHESLEITDFPGAVRAKTWRYWVWGWDGMTNNLSTAYWGDTRLMGDMLNFYRETADPERGIAHSYDRDMKITEVSPISAQCMYLVLMQDYYNHTGDLQTVRDNFSFAKKIFQMALDLEVENTGFLKGTSLFPDYRNMVGETGNDISALNNSIFYCALRSMNYLASILGDSETEELSKACIKKLESNFLDYFYDTDRKFVTSSLEASSYEQREVYQTSSVRWENNYYADLMKPVLADLLEFYEEHLVCEPGIRTIPRWCYAYGADENQLQSWWPVTDEIFIRMANMAGRKDLLEKWIGWITYWGNQLMCPEAVTCHIETDQPEADQWSALGGAWQAFAIRTWYQGIIHGIVGVDAGAGGLTFHPYSGEEMKLKGLHFQNRTFDIEMEGSGPFIDFIQVNGREIRGSNKLPLEHYENENHVSVLVHRTMKNPHPICIKSAQGVLLKDYQFDGRKIRTDILGAGFNRMEIWSAGKPVVKLDGRSFRVDYNPESKISIIELDLKPGKEYKLEITNR